MVPVNTNYGDYTKIKILNRLKLKNTSIQGLEMKNLKVKRKPKWLQNHKKKNRK